MAISRYVGARIKRIEDPRLITGNGAYLDDLRLPGAAHAVVLRSPHAHAGIKTLDLTGSRRHPGVLGVFSAHDFGERLPKVPGPANATIPVPAQFALALGCVRYVGEPVAVVVAEDRATALQAMELIEVGYDPLTAVIDPVRALAPGSALVHETLGTNAAFTAVTDVGDVDAAFARADLRVHQRMANQRLSAVSLEGRAVAAHWQASEGLTIWNSTQVPHELRDLIAQALTVNASDVRVVAPDVGGGFGPKLHVYPEDVLIPLLSRELRRPVIWVESRREHFATTCHGRGQVADVELAASADGRILGLRIRLTADLGAYLMRYTSAVPTFTPLMIHGPYTIEHVKVELTGAYTHKVPTGPYRGAGRPEATYYLERAMDLVASETGLDPVAVRERNFIPPERFPYKTGTGVTYDSGNYPAALREALRLGAYSELRQAQAARRQQGGPLLGIGLSSYVEICSFGPMEYGAVRLNEDATVTVKSGTSPHGQGAATAFAQIVADHLGVALDQVTVVHGDTAVVPKGHGTGGSRTLTEGGSAIFHAAQEVRGQILRVASHLLEAAESDVLLQHGGAHVVGSPHRSLSLKEVASAVYEGKRIPSGMKDEIAAASEFILKGSVFPFGTHLSVVEIDPETGTVRLVKHVAVDDCGNVINPLLVAGQVHGGIAQGLAQALLEEIVYDDQGQLLTASLLDYAVPKAAVMPAMHLTHTVTPSPKNPLGVKGVGEAGTIGATAAIVNAVVDALGPFGVRHLDMPLTSGKIWHAIRAGTAGRAELNPWRSE